MYVSILIKASLLLHNTQNNILSSSHENVIIFHLKISFKSFFLAKFLKTIVFQSCHYPIQCIYFLSLPRSYLNVKNIQFSLENDKLIILYRNYASNPEKDVLYTWRELPVLTSNVKIGSLGSIPVFLM